MPVHSGHLASIQSAERTCASGVSRGIGSDRASTRTESPTQHAASTAVLIVLPRRVPAFEPDDVTLPVHAIRAICPCAAHPTATAR